MNIYKERIEHIIQVMTDRGIDYYLIPLSDYHSSEYFDDYYNLIKQVSGFTGSNATLIVSKDGAYLWTDGRYYIQAREELSGSDITLMKQGSVGVPTPEGYLSSHIASDDVVAFDARLVSVRTYERIVSSLDGRGRIVDADIISDILVDRVKSDYKDIWILDDKYTGETIESKLLRIRGDANYKKADALFVSDLCDVAWTLNLRGSDIRYMPVFYAYMIIAKTSVVLYVDTNCIEDVSRYLSDNDISVRAYERIYDDLRSDAFYKSLGIYTMLIDDVTCNSALFCELNEHVDVLKSRSVIGSLKCIKNTTQIANNKRSHIKDGVAVTKFIYYIEQELSQGIEGKHSELSLSNVLHELRSKQEGFLEESFATISAWAEHGAIVHYEPTVESDSKIRRDNLLLVDSGGHYLDGTTDVTRTILIGDATPDMIRDYTLVLKSNIALASAIFVEGTSGKSLDMLARNVMWQHRLDYMHGTGHGVGHLLNVHEGPNIISIRAPHDVPITIGMVTTDEPGIYREGRYGIRLENELLCQLHSEEEFGRLFEFECLTLVPYQRSCIDAALLTPGEIKYLNDYHKRVFDEISPFLDEDERKWLRDATMTI